MGFFVRCLEIIVMKLKVAYTLKFTMMLHFPPNRKKGIRMKNCFDFDSW